MQCKQYAFYFLLSQGKNGEYLEGDQNKPQAPTILPRRDPPLSYDVL